MQILGRVAQQAAAVGRVVQPRLRLLDTRTLVGRLDRGDLGADLGLTRRSAVRVAGDRCCHGVHGIGSSRCAVKARLPLSGRNRKNGGKHLDARRHRRVVVCWRSIGAFDERHRSLALSELAHRAGLCRFPPRIGWPVSWLPDGALQRREDGRYEVGRLLWEAGLLAPVEGRLRQVAEPFLHDVYAATLATVHLAVRDGDEVLYLERMMGRASVPIVSSVGSRLPMHCTGVGKVLLAHAPQDVQARVFASLTRVTPYTIVAQPVLAAQLERIRRTAWRRRPRRCRLARVRWRCPWCGPPTTPWRRRSGWWCPTSNAIASDCSAPCRSRRAASAACCDRQGTMQSPQWSTSCRADRAPCGRAARSARPWSRGRSARRRWR